MTLLLPILVLATAISAQPHGYQHHLPKEYSSHTPQDGGSFSQLEMFRRFLQKFMSSDKTSNDNHPYHYMSHPMANVPVSKIRSDMVHTDLHLHQQDKQDKLRDHAEDHDHPRDDDSEQLPYTVVEDFKTYEKRFYPSATFVCNKAKIDTAADPLAGLERMNPYKVMTSKRYQKTRKYQMFSDLFKYMQGGNQDQEEVQMTHPVLVFHNVTKETALGNYEEVEMCFYLPSKYQENHEEHEGHEYQEHQENKQQDQPEEPQEDHQSARHAALPPPEPMENGRVYLFTRPAMHVFVRTFGGFALTHQSWEDQREILEEDLLGKKYNTEEYFTTSYPASYNPRNRINKRNEVWIQCLQAHQERLTSESENK